MRGEADGSELVSAESGSRSRRTGCEPTKSDGSADRRLSFRDSGECGMVDTPDMWADESDPAEGDPPYHDARLARVMVADMLCPRAWLSDSNDCELSLRACDRPLER